MIRRFFNWLKADPDSSKPSTPQLRRRVSAHNAIQTEPTRQKNMCKPDQAFDPYHASGGVIESGGPGKNVLVRNKYGRDESGTHETLTLVDDSMVDSGEESGVDPYNSGQFDRSKNWDVRFRD